MAEAGEGGAPGLSSPPRAPAGGAPRGGSWAGLGATNGSLAQGPSSLSNPAGEGAEEGAAVPPIQASPGMLLTLAPHVLCALLLL